MKAKITLLFAVVCALALSACDYCPRPGQFATTPWYYPAKPNKYPIPKVDPCGPIQVDIPPSGPVQPVH